MVGILVLDDVQLGYCDQCGRPCVPGVFRVFGWHHRFSICDVCLKDLGKAVCDGANKLLEKKFVKGGDVNV